MNLYVSLMRVIIVFAAAFIFGAQRQRSHKPVGFGTFIFVSTGACAMTLIGIEFYPENPITLIGSIITGIGFLGAGALIKDNDKIFGFTTAASLWLFAILGVVFGMGEYLLGSVLYGLVWIVILSDCYLEKNGVGSYRKKLTIETIGSIENRRVRDFLSSVGVKKTKLIAVELNKETGKNTFSYFVDGDQNRIKEIPLQIARHDWISFVGLK